MGLRRMTRSDLPALVAMSRENMAGIIHESWGEEWKDEMLMNLLLDQRVRTLVLEEGNEVIAYFCVEDVDEYVFISSFQVKKGWQGRGTGARMLERIESWGKTKGKAGIELCVQSTNERAKGFYHYHGYDLMYRNGNNLVMRKRLA